MQLLIKKPVRGYVNRGTDEERSILHASPGQKVSVVFNNTDLDKEGNLVGHYMCVPRGEHLETIIEERLYFPVFPSQVSLVIEEKNKEEKEDTDKTTEEDDPFSTLLSDDDET